MIDIQPAWPDTRSRWPPLRQPLRGGVRALVEAAGEAGTEKGSGVLLFAGMITLVQAAA
jgi:hypothetical protein